jgi:hypothetical protein
MLAEISEQNDAASSVPSIPAYEAFILRYNNGQPFDRSVSNLVGAAFYKPPLGYPWQVMEKETPDSIREIIISCGFLASNKTVDPNNIHRDMINEVFEVALSRCTQICNDTVSTILAIFARPPHESYSYVSRFGVEFLLGVDQSGHVFDESQKDQIRALSKQLRLVAGGQKSKSIVKDLMQRAKALDKIAPPREEVSDPFASYLCPKLYPLPSDHAFWHRFLQRLQSKLTILQHRAHDDSSENLAAFIEKLAAQLQPSPHLIAGKRKWEKKSDTFFDERAWSHYKEEKHTARLVYYNQFFNLAHEDIAAERSRLTAQVSLAWCCDWLPQASLLLDDDSPVERAFVRTIIHAPEGPKISAKWAKEANVNMDAIGRDTAEARLLAWLSFFSSAELPNGEQHSIEATAPLMRFAGYCEDTARLANCFSSWSDLDEPAIDQIEDVMAFICFAYGNSSLTGFWQWYANNPDPRYIDQENSKKNPIGRICDHKFFIPSLQNQTTLKGAVWMLGLIGGDAAVRQIEAVAFSAATKVGYEGYRSRTTTNAAIATLGEIGTQDALEALGRLRRAIKDKSVGNAVEKAMATLATKLGVLAADIAEQAMPDYGFA